MASLSRSPASRLSSARSIHLRMAPLFHQRVVVMRAAAPHEDAQPARHPEVPAEMCEETLLFNAQHLGLLQERILQIRKEQALHMLQHQYTPTTLHEAVEAALEQRPGLEEGARHLATWHEEQWAALRKKVHE